MSGVALEGGDAPRRRSRRRSRRRGRARAAPSSRRCCGCRRRRRGSSRPAIGASSPRTGASIGSGRASRAGRSRRSASRGARRERAVGGRDVAADGRRGAVRREVDGERAARARACWSTVISPPSRRDQLAADREAEAGAAVEAGGRAVALGERLEDPLLLLVVDADAGVADRERDDGRRVGRATAARGSSRGRRGRSARARCRAR